MKKLFIIATLFVFGQAWATSPKTKKETSQKSASKVVVDPKSKESAPCDTKEDILKKLEEEKKAQAAAGKGLSLQGSANTGCSVK